MALLLMGIIFGGACYKWGDWKHWKLYYPTLLFYMVGALTENIITAKKVLWLFYGSYPIDRLSDYIFGLLIFPSIEILFLSRYPKGFMRQLVYMLSFIGLMSLVELILYSTHLLVYYNGWTYGWSVLLYIGVFPLLRLHFKKPIVALVVLFALAIGGFIYFKLPLTA